MSARIAAEIQAGGRPRRSNSASDQKYARKSQEIAARPYKKSQQKTSHLASVSELARKLNVPVPTFARLVKKAGIEPDFESTNSKLFLPSRLEEIRAQLASASPTEKVRLVRQAREVRGTVLEFFGTLPSLEEVRKRISESKDARERAILGKYASAMRKTEPQKRK